MFRNCRSAVITSEVRVTRSRLNCSSRCCASATSATVPVPAFSAACSRLTISRASSTAFSAAPKLNVLLCQVQYCCSTDRTWAMISALSRCELDLGARRGHADDVVARLVRLGRGRLEPADRAAFGSRREDVDGLRVVQSDPDGFAKRHWPGLLGECRGSGFDRLDLPRLAAGVAVRPGLFSLDSFGFSAATRATVPSAGREQRPGHRSRPPSYLTCSRTWTLTLL